MRVKRWAAAATTTVLVAGIGITGSAPASADTINVPADCSSGGTVVVGLSVQQGDTITVSTTDCFKYGTGINIGTYLSDWPGAPDVGYTTGTGPYTLVVRSDAPLGLTGGTIFCVGDAASGNCGDNKTAYYLAISAGNLSASSSGDAAPIPDWVQAYGHDKDSACKDGWDPSWQEWAVPVSGGWVCTRSIPSLG